jgi:uncharacterized protein YneF (UPF0154 family)
MELTFISQFNNIYIWLLVIITVVVFALGFFLERLFKKEQIKKAIPPSSKFYSLF